MGYYFVGVGEVTLSGGYATPGSVQQVVSAASSLRESIIGNRLPEVIYSSGSSAGNLTAELLAAQLGIGRVETDEAFNGRGGFREATGLFGLRRVRVPLSPVEKMVRELERLENSGNPVNIAACPLSLLHQYLGDLYRRFGRDDLFDTLEGLKPGEGLIVEQHDDWGFELKVLYLLREREDVLVSY